MAAFVVALRLTESLCTMAMVLKLDQIRVFVVGVHGASNANLNATQTRVNTAANAPHQSWSWPSEASTPSLTLPRGCAASVPPARLVCAVNAHVLMVLARKVVKSVSRATKVGTATTATPRSIRRIAPIGASTARASTTATVVCV